MFVEFERHDCLVDNIRWYLQVNKNSSRSIEECEQSLLLWEKSCDGLHLNTISSKVASCIRDARELLL